VLLAALSSLILASAPASAQTMALEPQVRAHVGVNVVDGPSGIGFTGGLDSRLTRLIALDIGAFASPVPIAAAYEADPDATTVEYSQLRHGVYVEPGFRIPHPQPKKWAWDVFLRAGGGVIWTADLDPDAVGYTSSSDTRANPGGVVGGDALVRFGRVGLRASGKVWMYDVLQTSPAKDFFAARPQWSVEALVQW
jgi:hypothetical protein